MYVQATGEGGAVKLPQDYSGNAFFARAASEAADATQSNPPEPLQEPPPPAPLQENRTEPPTFAPQEPCEPSAPQEEAQPVFASAKPKGGAFAKLPFLSALLPPPRKKGGKNCEKEGGLPEGFELFDWLLLGAAILLFFTDRTDDVLPLLLLLLLWD